MAFDAMIPPKPVMLAGVTLDYPSASKPSGKGPVGAWIAFGISLVWAAFFLAMAASIYPYEWSHVLQRIGREFQVAWSMGPTWTGWWFRYLLIDLTYVVGAVIWFLVARSRR